MRHIRAVGFLTVVALPLAAQSDRDASLAALLSADRAAARRAEQGDFVAALSSLFAATGVHVTPTTTLAVGPAGAREWLLRDTLNATSRARWNVIRSGVSRDGRDAFTYGYFDVIRAAGDTAYGKYHAYWRRDPGGAWKILAFARGRRGPGPWIPAPAPIARSSSPAGPVDTLAALRSVFATEGEFADSVAVDFARGFGHFVESDGGKLNPPAVSYAFGREGIRGLIAQSPPGPGPLWRPEAGSVAASGDLAFTFGPAWPRSDGANPGPDSRGRYFTIWRLQPDGTWRYVVD